ncbi:MAG: hypothetical protein DMG21_03965 [Acidobacteria bacterium]|nr:MAG: hypothetical protein DMG21_03965 [Acidobacteriota bacterium]
MEEMAISKFKATSLAVLERVRKTRRPVLVTRFGKPVAEVVPPPPAPRPKRWLGSLAHTGLVAYVPAKSHEWFRWRSSDGILNGGLPSEPESWEALRTHAETISFEGLPSTLVKRPAFALWFILVYPHRFTPPIAKLTEDAIWKSTA